MTTHDVSPDSTTAPGDHRIWAARLVMEADRRLGDVSRPEIVALAARTMEREKPSAEPRPEPTDQQIWAARLVMEADERLGKSSRPEIVSLASRTMARERRAHDS